MQKDNLITTPTLFPLDPSNEACLRELIALLNTPARTLSEAVTKIAFDGGCSFLEQKIVALPVIRTQGTSGFNYSSGPKMLAYLRFGFTKSEYFVLQSMVLDGVSNWISHFYSLDGKYAFSEGPSSHPFAELPEHMLEENCPILNQLYNLAILEYPKTKEAKANTRVLNTIEQILRKIQNIRGNELSVSQGAQDGSIKAINEKLLSIELDPVYTWKERQTLLKSLKEDRAEIIRVKKRIHPRILFVYVLPLFVVDLKAGAYRFIKRPISNILGLLETLFIDPIRWFGKVVRGNMGYSIALAIYSPFTFFFITQPMNPHAMWAVGKVRSAYIESTERIKQVFMGVSTHAAVKEISETPKRNYSDLKSATGGILLSSDVQEVSQQTWDERMSNFKAMQISYEENMEIAPRIGRLEQMETQLNWPLIVESTWLETERYSNFLSFIDQNSKDYTQDFVNFVRAEKIRTDQVQLYLWDRNIRFILDHPYTMMDESKEQTQMDFYVGRSFVMLRDMTNSLAMKHQGLALPAGYDGIMKLAQKFDAEYKSSGSVLDRLKSNSKLFSQMDPKSTAELRSYMKRQWEILYLLQNHAQEASNFGLQMYIWSVRNAVYTLQSLYSTKREELSLLSLNFKKGNTPSKLSNNLSFKHIDSQYEALFHMLVLEYTSIRKEIGEALKKDIEADQRKQIIDGVESFLKERDFLLKSGNLI
jgi:hypothetical protein